MVTVDMQLSWNSSRLQAVRAMALRSASQMGSALVLPNSFRRRSMLKSTSGESSGRWSGAAQMAFRLASDCVTACSCSERRGCVPLALSTSAQSAAVPWRTSVQGTVADLRFAQVRRLAMMCASVSGR